MNRAVITHTRPVPFGGEGVETYTTVVEDGDLSLFHARVTGTVMGLVGEDSLPDTKIVGIQIEKFLSDPTDKV